MVGADFAHLVNEAALLAVKKKAITIDRQRNGYRIWDE